MRRPAPIARQRRALACALVLACTVAGADPSLAQELPEIMSASGALQGGTAESPRRAADVGQHPIRLEAGQRVIIDAASANFDTIVKLRLLGSDEVIAQNDDFGQGLDSRLTFTATEGADYVVDVTSVSANDGGAYQLKVSAAPDLPPAVTQENASLMKRWRLFRGELEEADVANSGSMFDDYQVELQRDQPVIILLDAVDIGLDPLVQVFPAEQRDGQPVAYNDDSNDGLNSTLLFSPAASGSYVIRVTSFEGNGTGSYQLRVGEVMPLEE